MSGETANELLLIGQGLQSRVCIWQVQTHEILRENIVYIIYASIITSSRPSDNELDPNQAEWIRKSTSP